MPTAAATFWRSLASFAIRFRRFCGTCPLGPSPTGRLAGLAVHWCRICTSVFLPSGCGPAVLLLSPRGFFPDLPFDLPLDGYGLRYHRVGLAERVVTHAHGRSYLVAGLTGAAVRWCRFCTTYFLGPSSAGRLAAALLSPCGFFPDLPFDLPLDGYGLRRRKVLPAGVLVALRLIARSNAQALQRAEVGQGRADAASDAQNFHRLRSVSVDLGSPDLNHRTATRS